MGEQPDEEEAREVLDKNKNPGLYPLPRHEGRFAFLRKGWFWGCLIAVVATSSIAPIAVATQRRLKEVPLPAGHAPGLGGPGSITMSAGGGGSGRPRVVALGELPKPPSCADLLGDLPPDVLVGGRAPPPLRADGGRLVSGAGGGPAVLRGVTLRGFEGDASFVALPGLRSDNATWEGADFATAVKTLRLLGFNTVRLPFAFDGLTAAPQDVVRPCPGAPPSDARLAARAQDPAQTRGPAPPPPQLYAPRANASGGCNAYVPRGPTTLARLLWTVDFLVRSGAYVALDYDTPAAGGGAAAAPPELDSPLAFAAAWQRLAAALACHPSWQGVLAGRVLLGLLSDPKAAGLGWDGGGGGGGGARGDVGGDGRPPLGDFALAAMDAVVGAVAANANRSAAAPPLFLLPGSEGLAGGGAGAAAFLVALPGPAYRDSVVVAAPSPGTAGGGGADGKARGSDAASLWDKLQSQGLCTPAAKAGASAACRRVPTLATAVLGQGGQPGGSAARALAKGSGWFWSYGGDGSSQGGLVGADGTTLQWGPLRWARDSLGLLPWRDQAGGKGGQRRLASFPSSFLG